MFFSCSCDVENIARLQACSSVNYFLSYDLGYRFEQNILTLNHSFNRGLHRLWFIHNEVDFTYIECQLQKLGAVAGVIDRLDIKCEVMLLRVEKAKQLRIAQKNIDIMTFAVFDLQHQRSSATEGPMIDYQFVRIDLSNDVARYTK